MDAPGEPPCIQHEVSHLYDIPLRACVSDEISNLMFAGRNISATHVAFASTRVMATCAAIGQGVGTAAAHAINAGLEPTEIPGNPHAMRAIQQRLLCDDCYLIGRLDEDEGDRAPSARITTSSETDDGADRNVASGQTRSVHGERGAPPDRAHPGSHRWMSSPEHGMPASIELHWDVPVPIRELRLVFDTGMHRHLTLSHSDRYTHMMHWGRPQEETVRDYAVEGRCESGWRCLFKVSGNYQRRRVHRLEEPATESSLRVTVNATNGVGQARICEVRVH